MISISLKVTRLIGIPITTAFDSSGVLTCEGILSCSEIIPCGE